jgi:hypothetical protein
LAQKRIVPRIESQAIRSPQIQSGQSKSIVVKSSSIVLARRRYLSGSIGCAPKPVAAPIPISPRETMTYAGSRIPTSFKYLCAALF